MKLELKHLTPYLAYELKSYNQYPNGEMFIQDVHLSNVMNFVNVDNRGQIILKPLSDYTDINSKAMNDLNLDVNDQIDLVEFANKIIGLNQISYGLYQIMCKNHIDFNRLIETGKAIDINTLDNA